VLLGEHWQKFTDISVAVDGSNFWALGSEKAGFGGYSLYSYLDGAWTKQQGVFHKIAADRSGDVWGIKDNGTVYQINNGQELARSDPGVAQSIACGADGSVWITCRPLAGKGIHLMYFDYMS
jgi:hypothetical protein